MALYTLLHRPRLERPVLVVALSGWVDAASVGTGAAEHLAEGGEPVAEFDRDALFDYRANRPVITFEDGRLTDVAWPSLELFHSSLGDRDLLVLTGGEPDFRWQELSADLKDLVELLDVERAITVGGVPAAVPHTLPPPVLATASDPAVLTSEDRVMEGTLIVPGAAVSILDEAMRTAGLPTVGYWVQVPHYLRDQYHAGVAALVQKVAANLAVDVPLGDLLARAAEQRAQLDATLAERPEAAAYVHRLEEIADEGPLPSADEIGAEVERFLREATDGNDPFGAGSE